MSYVFITIGVFLLCVVPYLIVKGKNAPNKKDFWKAVGFIASLGVIGIVIGIIELPPKDDNNSAQQAQPNHITWNVRGENVKSLDENKIKTLLYDFQEQCKGWTAYPEAIESAEATIRKFEKSKYESYAQETLGWYTEIELDIKIKDDAKFPTTLRMVPGNTLHYYIGGGKKPGILMIKEVSALFLGVPESQIATEGSTFVSNEAFKIADEIVTE